MLTSFGEPPPLAKLKKRAVLSKFLLALCYRSWRDLLRTVMNSCRWQELWTHPGSRDASVGNGQMAIVCHIVYSSIHPMSPCPNKSSHCATWKSAIGHRPRSGGPGFLLAIGWKLKPSFEDSYLDRWCHNPDVIEDWPALLSACCGSAETHGTTEDTHWWTFT